MFSSEPSEAVKLAETSNTANFSCESCITSRHQNTALQSAKQYELLSVQSADVCWKTQHSATLTVSG